MKKAAVAVLLTVMAMCVPATEGFTREMKNEPGGTVAISGAWALYPMTVKWAEEFQKVYPKIKIDISAGGAGKGMADCLAKVVDIGMVSRDIYPEEVNKGAWAVPVTRDAVVATVNVNNPSINDILSKGITRDVFRGIFITGDVKTFNVYTRSDACGAAEIWAKYLGGKQEDIVGIGVYGDPGLAEAVKKDIRGIGYNNINYAYDANTKGQVEGIRVVPIDINSDGRISANEDVYAGRDKIAAAIANGHYPSPPARELYFVSGGRPQNKEARLFIRWVLTDGQKYVPETGYINITKEKIKENLDKLGSD